MRLSELRAAVSHVLLELALGKDVTLYHRSGLDMQPGHVIKPNVSTETGQHWLVSNPGEKQIEEFRKREHPDKPSRLASVYMSLTPHARFSYKGSLYAVRPIGRIHIADSRIMDKVYDSTRFNSFDGREDDVQYYDMEQYWEGIEPTRANLKDVEVLADSAEVLEKIEEPKRMTSGKELSLPIAIRGQLGFEITGTVEDALAELEADGAKVVGKPRELYEPDKRPAWLQVEVEFPAGHRVVPYVKYMKKDDGGWRDEVADVALFDKKHRKMYLTQKQGFELLKAFRRTKR